MPALKPVMKAARRAVKFDPSVQRFRGAGGRFVTTPKPMPTGMRGAPTRVRTPTRPQGPLALNPGPKAPLALNPAPRAIPMGPASPVAPRALPPGNRPPLALNPGPRRPARPMSPRASGPLALNPGPALPPPPKSPSFFARHGKKVAAGVVAGGVIGGYTKNRTGKAVDPNTGLPKGVYGY